MRVDLAYHECVVFVDERAMVREDLLTVSYPHDRLQIHSLKEHHE